MIISLFLIFSKRIINFKFSLNRRCAIITFFFYFFSSLQFLHQFFDEERSQIILFALFFYFKDHCFLFFVFFNCLHRLMLLYNAMMIIVASTSRWIFVFAIVTYVVKMMIIFVVFRSISFNSLFIFFSVIVIYFFIVNVDNKTFTRWNKDTDMNAFISSIDLSCGKLLISLIMCFLRLFIENSFNVVRIFVKHLDISWTMT